MTNYTAEDFAVAKFAEHPNGLRAMRSGGKLAPWLIGLGESPWEWARDDSMAEKGWVPVLPNTTFKKRITRSEMDAALWDEDGDFRGDMNVANSLGIEVVPDPVTPNVEKLEKIFADLMKRQVSYLEAAVKMDSLGVRAPGGGS